MATKIFVNLPVKNLEKTKEFFGKLGFRFNPQFTDEKAACMVLSEDGYVMLLAEGFFKTFLKKEEEICDTTRSTEALICISAESREHVDEMIRKAVAAGGTRYQGEPQDHGFMYGNSFQDLDGHRWEVMWMDPKAAPPHG